MCLNLNLQESVDVCQDCVTFLTDAQAQAKANSTFLDGLIENVENQCDLLGPSMSSLVTAVYCAFFFFPSKCQLSVLELTGIPPSPQCREYVSQYSSLVVEQLMNMVSGPILPFHLPLHIPSLYCGMSSKN